MTTEIIHSDVAGTSFTGSEFDYSKLKATRKFIVYSTRTDLGAGTNGLLADLRDEDASDGVNVVKTLLGPLLTITDTGGSPAANAGQPIVHPDSNELPLGTVDVARLGDRKFLVTANYFVQPGVTGGSSTVPNTMSLRTELVATRRYTQAGSSSGASWFPVGLQAGQSPVGYSYVVTVVQLRIKIPFFEYANPLRGLSLFGYMGTVNTGNETLGGVEFNGGSLRFDGVSMDEFGSVVTSGSQTYKFKGYYEFTARADNWYEEVATLSPTGWQLTTQRPSINEGTTWLSADIFR